ncbi:MAG: PQQ-dependent sugar dehydrogenase [Cellvibrionaceae bacterium]|nr:PQQ-dependent sugar dehydrogenase [Cellvibrionaceae bacterium]
MLLALLCVSGSAGAAALTARVITDQLEHPWSMAFLPDGRFLISERVGRLRIVDAEGEVSAPISGLPDITVLGQGGLFDVALHPDFANNQLIYLSFSASDWLNRLFKKYNTEVIRAKLDGLHLKDIKTVFKAQPKTGGGVHFGGRLLFDRAGYLYISLGDRGLREEAQSLQSHLGTIVRVHDDGRVPSDNPFINTPKAKAEIFSYGHRNVQGLALHPDTGAVWAHEHGPQGGDEVNLLTRGGNYGWPVITYGAEYGSGFAIGEGTEKDGMIQPLHYWDPSIAPSGMGFYQGKLLIGALKSQRLVELHLQGQTIIDEQPLFANQFGRIRDLRVAADQRIYLLTDAPQGKLIQLQATAP